MTRQVPHPGAGTGAADFTLALEAAYDLHAPAVRAPRWPPAPPPSPPPAAAPAACAAVAAAAPAAHPGRAPPFPRRPGNMRR